MDKAKEQPPAYAADMTGGMPVCATAPVVTAYPTATQVVQAAPVIRPDCSRMPTKRTQTHFKLTLIMMEILLVFGVTMLIINAYTASKGVKTYDNYHRSDVWSRNTKIRRDWDQGIWSGVLHIVAATFFIVLYVRAKEANFNLDQGSLRGLSYFFCICVALLCVVAFIAMVMSGITAAFLRNKTATYYDRDSQKCVTLRGLDGTHCYCDSNDEYVAKATCNEAAGVYHDLFTTIAVLNAISVLLTIITSVFACMGSCVSCGAGYSSPAVMAAPAQVVQTVPQVGVVYPAQLQATTTY